MGDADRGPDVSDRDVLTVFERTDQATLRPREVANELPIGVEEVRTHLDDLSERDLVVQDEDAPDDHWRLGPEADDQGTVPEDRVETEVEAQATKTADSGVPPHEEETPDSPAPDPQAGTAMSLPDRSAEAVEAFDPPGTPDERDRRREAVRRAYAYLRTQGRASRADIESAVFPEAPGGYDNPDEGWWADVVAPGLGALDDVEPTGEGEEWQFTGANDGDVPEE